MWYLPTDTVTVHSGAKSHENRAQIANNVCATSTNMKKYVDLSKNNKLLEKCCMSASYFENKPKNI